MCFFNGIQHSASYNRTDSTQTWYTPLLIFKIKFLSLKSVFFKTPKTWDAFLFISHHLATSIQPEAAISEIQVMEILQHSINHHLPLILTLYHFLPSFI